MKWHFGITKSGCFWYGLVVCAGSARYARQVLSGGPMTQFAGGLAACWRQVRARLKGVQASSRPTTKIAILASAVYNLLQVQRSLCTGDKGKAWGMAGQRSKSASCFCSFGVKMLNANATGYANACFQDLSSSFQVNASLEDGIIKILSLEGLCGLCPFLISREMKSFKLRDIQQKIYPSPVATVAYNNITNI